MRLRHAPHNIHDLLRRDRRLEELALRHAVPELLAQARLDRPRVDPHADRGDPARLQVQVERPDRLVQRALRRAVRVPAAERVV